VDTKQEVIASIVQARNNLESALIDLEKLPAYDESSVPFAAHALNNFLSVSEGTVEFLQGVLPADSDPQIQRCLDGLRHATHLMMHTVSQLMNNSVITGMTFRFEKFDFSRLVDRACVYYQRLAQRKNIMVFYSAGADVPLVWSDRVAVAAVLDNLLSNAVKYSPHRKLITVHVEPKEADVLCSVQDQGPGLSGEDQGRLFQRGVRLSATPTGGEPSSGYGLAVAKELVEKLGGKIWVDSEFGKGTRFSIQLPTQADAETGGGRTQKTAG
jgi:signal transduction histidine kinase